MTDEIIHLLKFNDETKWNHNFTRNSSLSPYVIWIVSVLEIILYRRFEKKVSSFLKKMAGAFSL
jgi:hypothetical protein